MVPARSGNTASSHVVPTGKALTYGLHSAPVSPKILILFLSSFPLRTSRTSTSTPRATAPDGQAGKAESHQQDHDGNCPHESHIASSSLASARAFPDGTVGVSVARRGFDDADADRFPRPVSGAMIVELPLDPDAIAGLIGRRHRAAGCTLPEKEEPGHRQGREDEERVPEHPGSHVSPHHPIVRMPSRISDVRPPARE